MGDDKRGSRHLYSGFDESNHGHFPEIMTLAMTYEEGYTQLKRIGRKKSLKFFNNPASDLTYTFLSLNKSDYERIGRERILGVSIASLLSGYVDKKTSRLTIKVDGDESEASKDFIRNFVSKIYRLPRNLVHVVCGASLDEKDPLVRYADFCAHKIFKQFPPEEQSKHPQQRFLMGLAT